MSGVEAVLVPAASIATPIAAAVNMPLALPHMPSQPRTLRARGSRSATFVDASTV